VSEDLSRFVREALGRGFSRAEIEGVLLRAGWSAAQVRAATAGFADVDFPLPVPRPTPYLSARDAFQYLVLFGTLYVSAYNFGSLLFQIINLTLPDPAAAAFGRDSEYTRQSIRWSVSSLIVAFPVFLYTSWVIERSIRRDSNKAISKVRKWLTYVTLFLAAGVLIGDVTSLVYNLLGGELTLRFILKVATVGVIAGSIFWYYLSDLRREERDV
jgi:hypothetical protein